MPALRAQGANQRRVGMDGASPVVEENTGSFIMEPQNRAVGAGVPGDAFGDGKALVGSQAFYFIGNELDFLKRQQARQWLQEKPNVD